MEAIGNKFTRGYPVVAAPNSAQKKRKAGTSWLVWPASILMMFLPVLIVTRARSSDILGLLVAYLNVLVIGAAMTYFIRRRSYEAYIPVLFLIWYLISWPVASIYFGLLDPDAGYVTTSDEVRPFMENCLRLQAVDLVLLVGYLLTVLLLMPRVCKLPTFSAQNPATKRMVYVAAGISMFAFASGLYARLSWNYESGLGYLLAGIINYFFAVPIIIGVMFPKVPQVVKVTVLAFFAVTSPVYLLYHSRLLLIGPWMMMAFGLLFFSEWPQRKKKALILVTAFAFPMALMIGEVTRMGGKGWSGSLEERKEVLSNWQDFLARTSVIGSTMGRFFSTGGHSLITLSPEQVPYLELEPLRYVTELVVSTVVPGRVYTDYYYSSTYHLNRYGLRVGMTTSVELSLPGSLWMLGGWVPVFGGGVFVGLVHSAIMRWLHSATRASTYKGLFYLAMIAWAVTWGFNWDPITLTRAVVRAMLAAMLLWHLVVRPFLGPSTNTRAIAWRQSRALVTPRA